MQLNVIISHHSGGNPDVLAETSPSARAADHPQVTGRNVGRRPEMTSYSHQKLVKGKRLRLEMMKEKKLKGTVEETRQT